MPERSTDATSARPAIPSCTSTPDASSSRAPSARAIPAPPSLVADPPSPTSTRRAPRRAASSNSSPTPKVDARRAFAVQGSASVMPAASAISITAVLLSTMPYRAVTGAPTGPLTSSSINSPVRAAITASSVPSPPSAICRQATRASGAALRTPAAKSSSTFRLDADPLNESDAMSTEILAMNAPPSVPAAPAAPCRMRFLPTSGNDARAAPVCRARAHARQAKLTLLTLRCSSRRLQLRK